MAGTDPFGLAGQVLDGQFRVDGYVGEGGFSVVYRGTHIGLSEPIAVKCLKLPPALGSALVESFIKRFRDESRIHYKLSQGHLHIARCIASGTTVAPATSALVPYTALEWLDGRSLADDLDDRRRQRLSGRPLDEAVRLLDSAIDALAYAHAQGVVHRDLNPGNLFLTKTTSGVKLKVLDFGVAKVMSDSSLAMGPGARTLGNVRIFTPSYGAPEQFDDRIGSVGPWTDVYAVALVLLEVLTDRTIMDGEHIGELAAKALDPHWRPTPRALGVRVGDEVEAAMARAVALEPRERPLDAGQLWGLLKHANSADSDAGRSGPVARVSSSSAVRTLHMGGGGGSELSLPAVGSPRPSAASSGAFAHGGTLRMTDVPRLAPAAEVRPSPPPVPMPPAFVRSADVERGPRPAAHAQSRARSRVSILAILVLALLVLAALAAVWFLSPMRRAELPAWFASLGRRNT